MLEYCAYIYKLTKETCPPVKLSVPGLNHGPTSMITRRGSTGGLGGLNPPPPFGAPPPPQKKKKKKKKEKKKKKKR